MSNHSEYKLIYRLIVVSVIILAIVLIALAFAPSKAADEVTVCRDNESPSQFIFHFPAAWNNPELPTWWALGSVYQMIDDTTIKVDALTDVEIYSDGFPQWEQDLRIGQAVVGSGDYSIIVVADENTPFCNVPIESTSTPESTIETQALVAQQPVNQSVISTGRTCVVKYPEIILVCNR